MSWISDQGYNVGSIDPGHWQRINVPDISRQQNGHDYGIFSMAYVEHVADLKKIEFS